MIPIEVRSEVLAILFGGFTHAAVHYETQDYKHIQGAVDAFHTLDIVIVAPGGYVARSGHRIQRPPRKQELYPVFVIEG